MLEPILNIAVEAARTAGNIIIRALERPDTIKIAEKSPNNFVTNIDQRVEQEIIAIIQKAYPHHAILGEEGSEHSGSEYQWVIDPIDGTRNFIHGFPHFAVSIGIMHKNRPEYGVIYDPCRQGLFVASRGRGARLNDHRIRVSPRKRLDDCLLGTGFAYRHALPDYEAPADIFKSLIPLCGDIRRAGSAALDLAYVACGRLDSFFEFGLNLWDIAAGILLVKEAGGIICDPYGGEDYLKSGNVVAANPRLAPLLLKQMKPFLDKPST